jgi:hypothetical protein
VKNEVHGILAAHLVPPCPHTDPFNGPGRAWLAKQALPDDERAAILRHLRELAGWPRISPCSIATSVRPWSTTRM